VLLQLPAAAGFSAAAIDTLLHAAVDAVQQNGESHAVHVATLCGLGGAAAAGSEALVAALHAAIEAAAATKAPAQKSLQQSLRVQAAVQAAA
jgi:hypothetical protein